MTHIGETPVRSKEAELMGLGITGDFRIGRTSQADIAHIDHFVSKFPKNSSGRSRQILIDEEGHARAMTRSCSISFAA